MQGRDGKTSIYYITSFNFSSKYKYTYCVISIIKYLDHNYNMFVHCGLHYNIIIMPALHNLDAIRGKTRGKYKTKLVGKTQR